MPEPVVAAASSQPLGAAAPASSVEAHALTAQDLDIFFDGLIPNGMDLGDIAGGVLVVVKDGRILLSKGYGYSDVAKQKPVIPDRTVFREASITKTFTWTAVMQLVQAGKIDLESDVNDYLDFKIPPKFGKPITMRDLMTHTAGFEETGAGIEFPVPGHLVTLRQYLINHMPARIFPPGKIAAYSNYGGALAGYIVQRLSGESYDDYVADHIFKPLDMMHSSLEQPLPSALAADLSKGYRQASDPNLVPFEYIQTVPSSTLSATGTDMAHFMIAQLENGSYNGVSILNPVTTALMHSPQSRMAPGINGFDLGFLQQNRNGLRIIGHGGDMTAFHSDMELLLDKHVGIFLSFNSAGKGGVSGLLRRAIVHAFLDRYFPYTPPKEPTMADPRRDAARVVGWYQGSRRSDTALRLISVLGESSVTARPDGTIEVSGLNDLSGAPKRWREVEALAYRDAGGQSLLKFVTNGRGQIEYWTSDEGHGPTEVFQRLHGLYAYSMLKNLGGASFASWILTIVIWLGGWLMRRHYGATLDMPESAARWRLASRLGVVALFAMVLSWVVLFTVLVGFVDSFNQMLTIVYILGATAILGALAILVESVLRVLRGPGGWVVRFGEFVLGASALYALWFISAFGLANFSFRY